MLISFIHLFLNIKKNIFRPSFDWMRQMTVRNQIKNKIVSLGFNNIESQTLAAQLTYLEWKILRRITFTDYKTYAIKNTLQDNSRLERSIQFFNGLSTWIQCMVLSKMTPKQRAEIIHKFLDVAKVNFPKTKNNDYVLFLVFKRITKF
jgi:RAS guanyl-releasing protein 3